MSKIYSKEFLQSSDNSNVESSKDQNLTRPAIFQDDSSSPDQIYQSLPSAKGRLPANRLPPLERNVLKDEE
jgi:hypothetical protein